MACVYFFRLAPNSLYMMLWIWNFMKGYMYSVRKKLNLKMLNFKFPIFWIRAFHLSVPNLIPKSHRDIHSVLQININWLNYDIFSKSTLYLIKDSKKKVKLTALPLKSGSNFLSLHYFFFSLKKPTKKYTSMYLRCSTLI
jgi:hypothetical protein